MKKHQEILLYLLLSYQWSILVGLFIHLDNTENIVLTRFSQLTYSGV